MEGNYLITTDSWFIAPDGNEYRCVWGNVEILSDAILNVKTNARSTNWFAKIGSEDDHVIIAGCQIHYAVKCKDRPGTDGFGFEVINGEVKKYNYPNKIYVTDN